MPDMSLDNFESLDLFDRRLAELVTAARIEERERLQLACPAPLTEDSVQEIIAALRVEFPVTMGMESALIEVRRVSYTC